MIKMSTTRAPASATDPIQPWRNHYHSGEEFNVARLTRPELDDLLDNAASSNDDEERTELYHELAQIVKFEPWYGYLWQQGWDWAFSTSLKGSEGIWTHLWLEE